MTGSADYIHTGRAAVQILCQQSPVRKSLMSQSLQQEFDLKTLENSVIPESIRANRTLVMIIYQIKNTV